MNVLSLVAIAFALNAAYSSAQPGPTLGPCPNAFNVWVVTDRTFQTILACEEALQVTLNLGIWTKNFTSIVFPNLEHVQGPLTINVNYDAQLNGTLSFPSLKSVGGAIRIATSGAGNTAYIANVVFPALETVGSGITITTSGGGSIGDVTIGSPLGFLTVGSSININSGGSSFSSVTRDLVYSNVTYANIGLVRVHGLTMVSDITIDASNSTVAGLYVNKESPNVRLDFYGRFYARNFWGASAIGDVEIYGIGQIVSIYLETREGKIGNTLFSGSDSKPMRVFSQVHAFTWTNWYWIQVYPTWIFYETFNMGSIGNIRLDKVEMIGSVRLEARYSPIGDLSINGDNWEVNNGEILVNTWYNTTGHIGDVTLTGLATLRGNLRFIAYNATIGDVTVNGPSSTYALELFGSISVNTWVSESGSVGSVSVHGLSYVYGSITVTPGAGDIGDFTVTNGGNDAPITVTGAVSVQTGAFSSGTLGQVRIIDLGVVFGSVLVAPGASPLGNVEISGSSSAALDVRGGGIRVDPGTFADADIGTLTFNFIRSAASVTIALDISQIGSITFNGASEGFVVTSGSFSVTSLSSTTTLDASTGSLGSLKVTNFLGTPLGNIGVGNNHGSIASISFECVTDGCSLRGISLTGSSTNAGSVASISISNVKNVFTNVNVAPGANKFGAVSITGVSSGLTISGFLQLSQGLTFVDAFTVNGLASVASYLGVYGNIVPAGGVVRINVGPGQPLFSVGTDLNVQSNSEVQIGNLYKVGGNVYIPIQGTNTQGPVSISGGVSDELDIGGRVTIVSFVNESRAVTFSRVRIIRGGASSATIVSFSLTFFSVYRASSLFTNPTVTVNGVTVTAAPGFLGGYAFGSKLNDPGCINQCNGRGTANSYVASGVTKCNSTCQCWSYNVGATCQVENVCDIKPTCDCKCSPWSGWVSVRGSTYTDGTSEPAYQSRTCNPDTASVYGLNCATTKINSKPNECTKQEFEVTAPTATSHRICAKISDPCDKAAFYEVSDGRATFSNRVCKLLTVCNPNANIEPQFYESEAPTLSVDDDGNEYYVTDRKCTAIDECESLQYELSAPTTTTNRVCKNCTNCAALGDVETSSCTDTNDATCSSCISTCPANQYPYSACNVQLKQNTVCQFCRSCSFANGEYRKAECSQSVVGSDTDCQLIKTCVEGEQFESRVPTETSDRECKDYQAECIDGVTFEKASPTSTSDRVCQALIQACNWDGTQYEFIPVGGRPITADRDCRDLSEFPDSNGGASQYYISQNATSTSDRSFSLLLECQYPSQYEKVAPTLFSNRVCETSTVCELGVTFEIAALTKTSDRECASVSPNCAGGSINYESEAPTLSSDRVCTPVGQCESHQYEVTKPTLSSARVCGNVTQCLSTQYQVLAPTTTSNRECADRATCALTQYVIVEATPTSQTVCANTSAPCGKGEFESTAPVQGLTNRVCQGYKVCAVDEYQSASGTATSDIVCTKLATCVLGQTYESRRPTPSTDRECRDNKVCFKTEYESKAATLTSDRICFAARVCNSTQYQYSAYTATSNTVCASISGPCNTTYQYQSRASTFTSNRACSTLAVCKTGSQIVRVQATYSTNRVCETVCNASQYESRPYTATSDRRCINIRTCNPLTQYQTRAPTKTSDRACAWLTVCNALTQVQITAPTLTSNRVCKTACPSSSTTNQCLNDGVCYVVSGSGSSAKTQCSCPSGFSGVNCETSASQASSGGFIGGVSNDNGIVLFVLGGIALVVIVVAAVLIARRRNRNLQAPPASFDMNPSRPMLSYENPAFDSPGDRKASGSNSLYELQNAPYYDAPTMEGANFVRPSRTVSLRQYTSYELPEGALTRGQSEHSRRDTLWLKKDILSTGTDNVYDNVNGGNEVVADPQTKKEDYLLMSESD